MSDSIYRSGQATALFSVWNPKIDWFILGGTADADEAQTVKEKFPRVNCVGFEPGKRLREKQLKMKFPGELYHHALWNENTTLQFSDPIEHPRGAGVIREYGADESIKYPVEARTLDSLSEEFGPWKNSFLWLDIERAENQALEGADKILTEDVLMLNVEVMERSKRMTATERILTKYGFKLVKIWNTNSMPDMCDAIFSKS